VFVGGIIIVLSAGLLLYWFRYSCLLIVRSRREHALIFDVAQANHLSFPAVRERVATAEPASLESLYRSLSRDGEMLLYLLDHTVGPALPLVEKRLLALDFALMRIWYRIAFPFSKSHARAAVREMTDLVTCFADAMGRRASAPLQ
jgi:hypothetical protein